MMGTLAVKGLKLIIEGKHIRQNYNDTVILSEVNQVRLVNTNLISLVPKV